MTQFNPDDPLGLRNIGSARGGRKPSKELQVSVMRELGLDDIPLLIDPPPVGSAAPQIAQIRHSHHQLARLLAEGVPQVKIALITGYSVSRISILKADPMFAQLMSYYETQKEQIFVDVQERMAVLGLSTLEELQRRLDETPDDFTKRELMELVELTMIKSKAAPSNANSNAAVVPILNIQFVTPQGTTPVIDGEVN